MKFLAGLFIAGFGLMDGSGAYAGENGELNAGEKAIVPIAGMN